MECISLFLTSSFNKEWECLNLNGCHIQDKGLNILYHGLCHSSDVTIDMLWLHYNGLTVQSSSMISELTVKCKVKNLDISSNYTIGEDQQLYSILTDPSNVLKELGIWDARLSSGATIALFTALKENNKLKELFTEVDNITDDALDAITTALESNSCLVEFIFTNPLSSEVIIKMVQCLEANNTLQLITLPSCPEDIQEDIISLQEVVNEKRESRGCLVKLEIEFDID